MSTLVSWIFQDVPAYLRQSGNEVELLNKVRMLKATDIKLDSGPSRRDRRVSDNPI